MAEHDDNTQERTESPTERRKREAHTQGQFLRSKELTSALIITFGVIVLMISSKWMYHHFYLVFKKTWSFSHRDLFSSMTLFKDIKFALIQAGYIIFPISIACIGMAFLSNFLMGGIKFSSQIFHPKFSRLNPIQGLSRMFSTQGWIEMAKSIVKVIIISGFCAMVYHYRFNTLLVYTQKSSPRTLLDAMDILSWSTLSVVSSLILIALLDIPIQIFQYTKNLKMTKQELREELKNTEGNPEVRARIRRLQERLAKQRMLMDVKKADVIITNPTHYAVALKYDKNKAGAPKLVAKGADLMAIQIQNIARAHQVYVFQAPPLARSIFHSTEIGREIPYGLYVAVAQVLAYVYQLKAYTTGKGKAPRVPKDFPIPDDLKR